MRYRKANRDLTQHAIAAAMTELGAVVTDLAAVGGGVPDLLVSYRGLWFVVECKSHKRVSHRWTAGKILNDNQKAWHAAQRADVAVVETPEQATTWLIGHTTKRL